MDQPRQMFSAGRLHGRRRSDRSLPGRVRPGRLPWTVTLPLIASLSLALWFGLWQLAARALGG